MRPQQTFLVIQTAFLGDLVLATAVVEKLKSCYPQSKIDFLVKKENANVLANNPNLNRVYTFDKDKKYAELFRLLKEIRSQKYSYVINLQRFASTGFLTAFSGGNQTVGYNKNPFSLLFSKRISHKVDGRHEVERNQLLIESITDNLPAMPKIYPSTVDFDFVDRFTNAPFVTIAPASVWFTKQWPFKKWVELILNIQPGIKVYLLGGPSDIDLCQSISALLQNRKNIEILAGKLTILQSGALMKFAQMNFVNDSGPMHLASAMNAPVTAIYCSTVPEFGFGPLSDIKKIVEYKGLACRPCGLHGLKSCPLGHFKCAENIGFKEVLQGSTLLQIGNN